MTPSQALDALAERHGILGSFVDLSGQERATGPDTKKALLRANGLAPDNDAAILDALRALEADEAARRFPRELVALAGAPAPVALGPGDAWRLDFDGGAQTMQGTGPGDLRRTPLPPGMHALTVGSGAARERITLIAAPPAAPSIEALTGRARLWGLNAALYGLRSGRDAGLGDFEDLARLAEAAAAHGAGYLGLNPIHALGWSARDVISPYSPSHRGFLNPMHIAVDRIPGLEGSGKARALLAGAQIGLGPVKAAELVDYAGHRRQLAPLLEKLCAVFRDEAADQARDSFAAFRDDGGRALDDFTLFEALSETHGPDWRAWPETLRRATGPGVGAARAELAGRMAFHAWLQWVCATQIGDVQTRAKRAGMPLGLYLDLAVGARRGGAETWCEGGAVAQGVSIGAPPDHLSPEGQNWDLAAYAPGKLAQGGYGAFRQVLRETMRHAGILRIDHVLGMNRSFWIPDDGSPGGYIRQPFKSLLAIIAIEADRARTAVIGEDLGLTPDGFRDQINAHGLYSYTVLQYEKDAEGRFRAPDALRAQSLACFGTHDTPTLRGFQIGRDIDWWRKLGWTDDDGAAAARETRRAEVAALLALGDGGADLVAPVHAALARSPAAMVSVQLDDLMGRAEAQNLPGTIDAHPNWRRRASMPVDRFADWPELAETARIMTDNQRGATPAAPKERPR